MQMAAKCGVAAKSTVEKPHELPLRTIEDVEAFNFVDDDKYNATLQYFHCVGGFSLKETRRLCIREAFEDGVLRNYSWRGREEENLPLQATRITKAIHDPLGMTAHFSKPARMDSAVAIMAAFRMTKERLRSTNRRTTCGCGHGSNSNNYWTDEQNE